jgi:hypothetical protein
MKIRKICYVGTALITGLCSLALINVATVLAAGNDCTWTGAGDGTSFSDASNWSSCGSTVPQTGDNLVFDISSLGSGYASLTDDISNLSVNDITFSGNNTWPSTNTFYGLVISGNALAVTGNMTNATTSTDSTQYNQLEFDNDMTISGSPTLAAGHGGFSFKGAISGSGTITTTGDDSIYGAGSVDFSGTGSSFSGTIDATSGQLNVATSGAVGTAYLIAGNGATLFVGGCTLGASTFTNNISLSGTSSVPSGLEPNAKLVVGAVCHGSISQDVVYNAATADQTFTLSGHVTLSSNVTFGGKATTTTLTGPFSGSYKFTLPGVTYGGALVVNSSSNTSAMINGTYKPATINETLTGNHADKSLYIGTEYAVAVDGVEGDTTVADGGTLEGSGTVGTLAVNSGGTVAPGHSPGCLSSGNLTINGSYQFQIGGTTACSGYDQIDVTGTVTLTGATLDASLYDSYAPKKGESYTIIKNDGTDSVSGTFTGLAEGATFKVGDDVLKITYKGGTGNDVVLTVVSAPTPATPNTGYGVPATSGPMIQALEIVSTIAITAGLLVLYRTKKSRS